MTITADQFEQAVGCAPQQDDMERVNCPYAGQIGHTRCGWCKKHNNPRFVCGCKVPVREVKS